MIKDRNIVIEIDEMQYKMLCINFMWNGKSYNN